MSNLIGKSMRVQIRDWGFEWTQKICQKINQKSWKDSTIPACTVTKCWAHKRPGVSNFIGKSMRVQIKDWGFECT